MSPYCGGSINHHSRRGTLGPWVERNVAEDIHFQDVFNKDEVEAVLVRAQRAILNPSQDWKKFLSTGKFHFGSEDAEREDFEVKFSPNIVRMSVSDSTMISLDLI